MASPENDKIAIAVKSGAGSATEQVTVIFDKSGFAGLSDQERSQKVEAAIREQLPAEAADKFINAKIEQTKEYIIDYGGEYADLLLDGLEDQGYNLYNILMHPRSEKALSSDQKAGGTEFCAVEHGSLENQIDEMADTISKITGADASKIRENFTADPAEHAKRLGAHEAQHCDGNAGLDGESQADQESYENITPDASLEYRDFRALTAMYDAGHASNPIVMGNQPSGGTLIEFQVGALHSGVSRVFDSLVEDYMGVDNKTHSSDWDINKYSAAVDEMKADLINSTNAMPDGSEKTEALIVAEATINYAEDYEDAYRRRVLGENVPERTPVELVSMENKEAFYNNDFNASDYDKSKTEEIHSNIKNNIQEHKPAIKSVTPQASNDLENTSDPSVIEHSNLSSVLPPDSELTVQSCGQVIGAVSFCPVISAVAESTVQLSQMVNGQEMNLQEVEQQRQIAQLQQQQQIATQGNDMFQIPKEPTLG